MTTDVTMTSNRPYLIRGLYDWITDNGLTPHILADASKSGVQVPPQAVQEGRVVLNVAARAVSNLELGNEYIMFKARFGGVSQSVSIPVEAVLAVYARENGQGMLFPTDDKPEPPPDGEGGKRPHLKVVK